jgi:hypothetical protein
VSKVCPAQGRRAGRQGGLDPRGENSARRPLDPDAPERLAEGSLQAPRPTTEALAAEECERNYNPSRPPLLSH